jgi:hypothetical protein
VAVRHLRQQKNRLLRLRNEDGFGHNSDYDFGYSQDDCPARTVHGAHGVTRPTTKSKRSRLVGGQSLARRFFNSVGSV